MKKTHIDPHATKRRRPVARRPRKGTLAACAVIVGALLALAVPAIASAHAYLVSADPGPDAIVKAAPTTITLHFAENVNPQGSDVIVYDSAGKQVSSGATVDTADLKTMHVNMTGTDSEIYLVEWHTVSADDGEADIGAYTFTVNPKATSTSSAPTTPTTSSSSGVSGLVAALLAVAGLIVGGAAGFFLARRSSTTAAK